MALPTSTPCRSLRTSHATKVRVVLWTQKAVAIIRLLFILVGSYWLYDLRGDKFNMFNEDEEFLCHDG